MQPNSIVKLPHIDEDGYFDHMVSCMVDSKGRLLLGQDCFEIEPPADDGKHFYKLSADKTSWEAEKIPETPEEFDGIVLDHHKQTTRIHRLREVLNKVVEENPEKYRLRQDPETNARSIEKIPEKTVEELREEKLSALDAAFSSWYSDGATMISSLGFEADCDSRAMQDVNGLVTAAEAQQTFDADGGLIFMDAKNVGHSVTLRDLKTLQLEIISAGNDA